MIDAWRASGGHGGQQQWMRRDGRRKVRQNAAGRWYIQHSHPALWRAAPDGRTFDTAEQAMLAAGD